MITVHYTQANLEMFGHAGLEPMLAKWLAEPPEPKRSQVANIRVLQAKLCSVLGLQLLKNVRSLSITSLLPTPASGQEWQRTEAGS